MAVRILVVDGSGSEARELARAVAADLGLPLVTPGVVGGGPLPAAWVGLAAVADVAQAAELDQALAETGGAPQLVLYLEPPAAPGSRQPFEPARLEHPAAAQFAPDGRWRRVRLEGGMAGGRAVVRRILADQQASRRPAVPLRVPDPVPGPAETDPIPVARPPAAAPEAAAATGSWKATAERRGRLVRRAPGSGPPRRRY